MFPIFETSHNLKESFKYLIIEVAKAHYMFFGNRLLSTLHFIKKNTSPSEVNGTVFGSACVGVSEEITNPTYHPKWHSMTKQEISSMN